MCGFAGIFAGSRKTNGDLGSVAEAMAATLGHRGPDDQGAWVDHEAGIALGFRRLAIIDLSQEGRQPMQSHSGRFTLAYNGEVYNHEVLRRELELHGARFRGDSDTEVILSAFEKWGVSDAILRFEGMFAMALWDSEDRSLTLVRDRLGIKPLFYQARAGTLLFGSELKALAAAPGFDRTLDTEALTSYLRYLYVPAPSTIYRHTRKLPPGHSLRIGDLDASFPDPQAYWSLPDVAATRRSAPFQGSPEEAVDALEALLLDSVSAHMRADVPLGAFLSAGIDSSTVVSMMQEVAPRPVRTFSVAFDVTKHNEAPEAARIARHIGSDHTELMLTGTEALDVVPLLPEIFDEPHADTSQVPVYMLCAKARKEVTVALSGDGGDEVFAGYNRYTYGPELFERLMRIPRPARRMLSAGIASVSPASWDRVHGALSPFLPSSLRQRLVGEKIHKTGRMLKAASPSGMYRSLVSAWPEPEALVVGGTDTSTTFEQTIESDTDSLLTRILLGDQLVYLPDDQLAKVDRASMSVGLEVRVPLVDHRLVEFAWSLPQELKIRGTTGKWILRQVLHRRVPSELMERPKMGLSVPVGRWLRGPLKPWAEALLEEARLEREGVLAAGPIRRAWSGLLRGREEDSLGLWAVLIFQAWQERWLS